MNGPQFRIAHLSDTHVSPEYNRRNILKLKNILSYVVDGGYDHVVITGDITGHGEDRDYKSVRRLLKFFGLLDYDRLSVTIGNHDIFGGVHRAEDLLSFGNHCRMTDYDAKVSLFERTFMETFPKKAVSNESLFPFVKFVGPVALIGMNSISRFHPILNPFGSNGIVSDSQLESVENILSHPSVSGFKKLIMIHHHFNKYEPHTESIAARMYSAFESRTLKLHGKKIVAASFIENGVEVVLHGHTHIEGIYTESGMTFSSTALNTIESKSDAEAGAGDTRQRFNEISVMEDGSVEVTKHRIPAHSKGSSSRALDRKFC